MGDLTQGYAEPCPGLSHQAPSVRVSPSRRIPNPGYDPDDLRARE
jgi:hypothetical protein